jgi:hypothetical protein
MEKGEPQRDYDIRVGLSFEPVIRRWLNICLNGDYGIYVNPLGTTRMHNVHRMYVDMDGDLIIEILD